MQCYTLRSATANSGLTALVTPRRQALSESSLPPLSPECCSATGVPPVLEQSMLEDDMARPPGDPLGTTDEIRTEEVIEHFVPISRLPGQFMSDSGDEGPWSVVHCKHRRE